MTSLLLWRHIKAKAPQKISLFVMSIKYLPLTDPRCHGNKIWDEMGYNSAHVRHICEIFTSIGKVFGDGPSNAASWILRQSTSIVMAIKFETKWAITRLVQEIFPRSLWQTGVLGDWLLDDTNLILLQPTLVAMAMTIVEFGPKIIIEMVGVAVVGLV